MFMPFPLDPIVSTIEITDTNLIVELTDGRRLSVPLAWYPRLLHGTVAERLSRKFSVKFRKLHLMLLT